MLDKVFDKLYFHCRTPQGIVFFSSASSGDRFTHTVKAKMNLFNDDWLITYIEVNTIMKTKHTK